MDISEEQRRNAERELTSIVCAGCDGGKQRGYPFCPKCTELLVAQGGKTGKTAQDYTESLEFLLSREGQQLRRSLESANAVATHSSAP